MGHTKQGNKQFQGSGIEKMEDNLAGRLRLVSVPLQNPTPQLPVEPRIIHKHWTDGQIQGKEIGKKLTKSSFAFYSKTREYVSNSYLTKKQWRHESPENWGD